MATETLNNPFAGLGNPVNGDRFIGRRKELDILSQRVLGEDYGNLAIIGLPRIGKSSLVWKGIMDIREELAAQKTVAVLLNCGSFSSSEKFFRGMVNESIEEMELRFNQDERFKELSPKYREVPGQEYDENNVQRYFKFVKALGYKTIFVLDEFDGVRDYFDVADFQRLRELSYNLDTKLCLVTCSRKYIDDIEVKDRAISNFVGTFKAIYLGMFNAEDVNLYWEHFKNAWNPNEEYKKKVAYYSGNHPWLMDWINDHQFQSQNESHNNFEFADNFKLELMDLLDSILKVLSEEGLMNATIELVLGPLYDVSEKQVEKLLRYGVIREVSDDDKRALFNGIEIESYWRDSGFLLFSDYGSLDLYRRYVADVPYLAWWSETENLLRATIKNFLSLLFKRDWEGELENYINNNLPFPSFDIMRWRDDLDDLKDIKDRCVANFPQKASDHLVDFTLTRHIFDVFIVPAKRWFSNCVFRDNPWGEWKKRFDFLKTFRNMAAHNNIVGLEEEERVAKDYCRDINHYIAKWQQEKQASITESQGVDVPAEDMVKEPIQQDEVESKEIKVADQAKEYIKGPTVVGSVDVSKIGHKSNEGLVDGKKYEGMIVRKEGKMKIDFAGLPYSLSMEGSVPDELYEEDNVIFTLSSRPNDKDPNKTYRFATDVQLKDEG